MTVLQVLVRRPAGAALLTTTALWFVAWLAFPLAGFWRTAVLNVLWTLVATSGALACFAAARARGDLSVRRPLILLGAGSLSWALGQAVWTWYTLVPRIEVPDPSVADVGYLAAPVLILAALILWPSAKRRLRRADVLQLVLVIGTTVLFAFTFFVEPVLSAGISGLAEVIKLSYASCATAVFALLAAGLVTGSAAERGRRVLVAIGLLSLTVAGAGFGIGGSGSAATFEPARAIPFLLFGIAALAPRSLDHVMQIPAWIAPLGFGLLFLGPHAKHVISDGSVKGTIEDLALFVVLGLLVARYFVLARDERNEARELARTRDEFVAQMVTTQEYDSRRVAELLHEDVVQQLTALGIRLELASMRSGDGSLIELSTSAGQIMTSLRRLLVDLHPAVLESQGFAAAVDVAAAELRATGVQVGVLPFGKRFDHTLEQLAYRAVQEAFKNVLAHARAERVTVGIVERNNVLFCEISDDGRGFDATEPIDVIRPGALGMKLVRKRIELAGGTFSLRSTPGKGSTFAFTLPMHGVSIEPPVHAEVA